jgi:DNA-binding transcriptional regulator YiaG
MERATQSGHVRKKALGRSRPGAVDVRALRERAGLSQENLARVLDTTWGTVSRWERGVAKPEPDIEARLGRLARLIGVIGRALQPEALPRFLATPHPLLRGFAPVDLLKSEYSFMDLVAFVEAAKSGDMA